MVKEFDNKLADSQATEVKPVHSSGNKNQVL